MNKEQNWVTVESGSGCMCTTIWKQLGIITKFLESGRVFSYDLDEQLFPVTDREEETVPSYMRAYKKDGPCNLSV